MDPLNPFGPVRITKYKTVEKHKIYTDLANIATLMISRSYLPELPKNIKDALGFNYSK